MQETKRGATLASQDDAAGVSLAVIGDPVSHSLSPAMHGAALGAAGLGGSYQAIRVPPDELSTSVQLLREQGCRGFNVTIPHKETIGAYLDKLSAEARMVGAVNTVVDHAGRWIGHNTDIPGFLRALARLDVAVEGRTAVLFGAGGAARAVAFALARRGGRVVIANRSLERATRLACAVGRETAAVGPHDRELRKAVSEAALLVNATSMGMKQQPDLSPLPESVELPRQCAVMDLVYGRMTPFLARARAAGCRSMDGLEMLVQQGAESFRLWTGIEPDTDAMRRACEKHLEEVTSCCDS